MRWIIVQLEIPAVTNKNLGYMLVFSPPLVFLSPSSTNRAILGSVKTYKPKSCASTKQISDQSKMFVGTVSYNDSNSPGKLTHEVVIFQGETKELDEMSFLALSQSIQQPLVEVSFPFVSASGKICRPQLLLQPEKKPSPKQTFMFFFFLAP